MPDMTRSRLQGSKYDKILRENMRVAMPGIMKNVLGLHIADVQELKDKIQITRQKEVDALQIITDTAGNTYILHMEFETKNKRKMNFRMGEYRCMLHQIYDYPIKQYVIYMGKARLSTPNRIDLPGLRFEYSIISISDLPYRVFLSSNAPEEQVLSVLANFGEEDPAIVIKTILMKLKYSSGGLTDNKYYEQLRVLLQMRNLDKEKDKAMDSVNTFFKIERDTLYKWGVRDGKAKARIALDKAEKKKMVCNMAVKLKSHKIAIELIADVTGLSVKEIKTL